MTGYHGNPYQMTNGALLDDESVFVAIDADVDTTIGRVLGRPSLPALGRARCTLEADPLLPFVVRRYDAPPGPGTNFLDFVATEATSATGAVDPVDPRGFNGQRLPASELNPGPEFEMYGPHSQATNNSFRGFIALDVRDFTDAGSRQYYNGATDTMSSNALKGHHAVYLTDPYPGPALPAVTTPPTGGTQVGVLSGVSAAHSTGPVRRQVLGRRPADLRRLQRNGDVDPGLLDPASGRDRPAGHHVVARSMAHRSRCRATPPSPATSALGSSATSMPRRPAIPSTTSFRIPR